MSTSRWSKRRADVVILTAIIEERLEAARGLLGSYEVLDQEEVESERARFVSILVHGHSKEKYLEEARRDTQNDTPSLVRDWLRGLPMGPSDPIVILWPDLGSGVIATWGGFIAAYDDLWYPSSDDVWIHAVSGEWLLELNHEEVFRFFRKMKPTI